MMASTYSAGKWLTLPSILFCLCHLVAPPPSLTAQSLSFDPPEKLLKVHRQKILPLSSDKEALAFHQNFMAHQRPSRHSHTRRKSSHDSQSLNPISQELQTTITTFWAAATTIGILKEFRAGAEDSLPKNAFKPFTPSDAQRQWLISKPSLIGIKDLVEFQHHLLPWPQWPSRAPSSSNAYSQFDKVYQSIDLTSDRQMWIGLFHDHGFKGIRTKLEEYWKGNDQSEIGVAASESQKEASIQHYIQSKLFPIFFAHLLTQANQLEAQAHKTAWESWNHIQEWQQSEVLLLAKRRLCGTWKWIIHNHQNHGDHKTTMTFASPEESSPPQVQPSTILIHGDTVFLKWIFPQGIQEDSLLFSNRDTRLEGTFTNSMGPHGSISGQRLSPCKH